LKNEQSCPVFRLDSFEFRNNTSTDVLHNWIQAPPENKALLRLRSAGVITKLGLGVL
jgi:hypothetical protein